MNVYERLGKTIEERDAETASHVGTLHLLHRLKRGELNLDDVYLIDNGWTLSPPGTNGTARLRIDQPQVSDVSAPPEGDDDE